MGAACYVHWAITKACAENLSCLTLQVGAPQVSPQSSWTILFICDWLHIIWRIRVFLLSADRWLRFGGQLYTPEVLHANRQALGLTEADLDVHDKQSYKGRHLKHALPRRNVPVYMQVSCKKSSASL